MNMPQPLKPGYSLQYRPQIILERPEHAIGIALVASEWAALEEEIFFSFQFALFAFDPIEHASRLVALNAWNAIDSIRARLDFIEAVAERKLPSDLFNQFREKIRTDIQRRAGERNRVVHGHWNLCDKYPNDIILNSSREERMRYSVKDFHEIAARINSTLNMTATYWHRVREHLYPTPPLPPSVTPS